jgi:hypothetical protein
VLDNRHLPGIQLPWPTLADRQGLVRIEVRRLDDLMPLTILYGLRYPSVDSFDVQLQRLDPQSSLLP